MQEPKKGNYIQVECHGSFASLPPQEKAVELLLAEVHWAKAEDGTAWATALRKGASWVAVMEAKLACRSAGI